jgi:hypothetical protein
MYFTSGSDRAFEQLMQTRPGADHFDSGEAGAPEGCGTCRFYRPHWKYQFCVYEECPYQPGKLTALDGAVKFQVKGVDDEMAVFRVEKNRGYTVMSNHHLRNKDLSLKAKGLLSQMLSLPESWDFTLKGLSLINREQIDAIRAAVRELEQAGYIVRSRERDSQGRLRGADYIIYEQPQPVPDSPTLENPTLDNPTQEKPTQEKPTQLNKDRSSKEKSITDGSNTDSILILSPPSPLGEEAAAPPERKGTGAKSQSAVEIYREIIKDNIEYEFIPYMELHCNLAAMEQEARRPLRSGETLTPEQTAYFNAVLDYVKECRPLLNQGQYHLPEPPQLADFDQSLQDYKKQIEAELEQEAAATGLTVEEYVASDYEAPAQPNFSIYQVPPCPEGRDLRYRSYEDLQADGLSVDRKNYQLVYTAPLDKDTTLDEIYRRFNIEHPADYKGHSLSTGDIVVFRQDGKQIAYYVDEGADYRQVPEFFAQPEKQLTPDECMTGEQIQTPRGRFYLTDRSREQMEAAGYGFHHQSEDGRYLIMANGTRAFAIPAQPESHIKTAEMSTEQNYNMIDGMMNNAPSMEELEARAKAGEQISLLDVAEAAKAEAKKPKQTRKTTQKQKKPSIRAQLAAAKEEQKKRPPAREKSKEMEV